MTVVLRVFAVVAALVAAVLLVVFVVRLLHSSGNGGNNNGGNGTNTACPALKGKFLTNIRLVGDVPPGGTTTQPNEEACSNQCLQMSPDVVGYSYDTYHGVNTCQCIQPPVGTLQVESQLSSMFFER